MAPWTRVADAKVPAKLVAKCFADRFLRVNDVHGKTAQLNAIASRRDTIAELVVVAEVVDQGFEPSDFSQVPFRSCHHRAQHEVESTEIAGDEYTRREVGAIAQRFEIGGESAVRQAAIEARYSSHFRTRERLHDRSKKSLLHANIAITDDHDIVACFATHAAEFFHLVADAQRFRTDQQPNRALRKIGY